MRAVFLKDGERREEGRKKERKGTNPKISPLSLQRFPPTDGQGTRGIINCQIFFSFPPLKFSPTSSHALPPSLLLRWIRKTVGKRLALTLAPRMRMLHLRKTSLQCIRMLHVWACNRNWAAASKASLSLTPARQEAPGSDPHRRVRTIFKGLHAQYAPTATAPLVLWAMCTCTKARLPSLHCPLYLILTPSPLPHAMRWPWTLLHPRKPDPGPAATTNNRM